MQIAGYIADMGAGEALATLIVSMLPVIELRGAIPMGVGLGLPVWQAAVIAMVGNMLPVPFIIAFVRTLMDWLRTKSDRARRFVSWLERKGSGEKALRVQQTQFWGLLLFVAVPLPGTGAWTGALIAAMLNMRMKRALPPILLGVLIAGIIVSLATAGVIRLLV